MSNEPSFDDFEYPGNRASIFGQIQQIISADAMVPSFNDSLVNNFNVQYRNKETSEVISVSEVSPYPSAVVNAILRSDKRVKMTQKSTIKMKIKQTLFIQFH